MKIGIGVSTGTEVVCAALVVEHHNGTRTAEFRTVSADRDVNSDIGDLVASAIELVASLTPRIPAGADGADNRSAPDAIAVSYRDREQASSIRTALSHSHRSVLLVPESAAGLAYLDDAGLIARYATVAVVDVGASGTTATVVDPATGTVRATERTELFSGDIATQVVKDLVHGGGRDDRARGSARFRTAKEHLSGHDSAAVGGDSATTVDRASFDEALRPRALTAAAFVDENAHAVDATLAAVVLIGGGAHIPVVRSTLESSLKVPVLVPDEPDTVLAEGAALLALDTAAHTSASGAAYSTAGLGANNSGRSPGRHSGAVIAAVIAGGIMVAYGFAAIASDDAADVSPAGSTVPTENEARTTTSVADVPSVDADPWDDESSILGGDLRTAQPSTTPTLHPAPDLQVIPWPARPSGAQLAPEPTNVTPESEPTPDTARTAPDATTPTTTQPDRTPSPTESSPSAPVPTAPDTATPELGTSPVGTPTEEAPPGEATPVEPTEPSGTTESSDPTTPVTVPTTEVRDTSTDGEDAASPTLTPPPTVWTPAPAGTS